VEKVTEQRLQRGLRVGNRVLDGVEVGLDFHHKLREGAAMFGRKRIEQRQGFLIQGVAAGGDFSEVMYEVASQRIASKAELREFSAELTLQLNHIFGFSVAHGNWMRRRTSAVRIP